MATRIANVDALYSPIYDEFMYETYAMDAQVNPKIFEQVEDHTSQYLTHGLSALGEWEDADEMESGGYEDPSLVYAKTYTQAKKWKKFQVSFEAVDFDEYALLEKEDEAKSMGRGAHARVERDTATVLHGGFATAGPDGQYLISDNHPKNPDETSTTYDNLLDGPLSHDNLELAEKQISDNFKDAKGLPVVYTQSPCLAYAPALRGTVARLLSERAIGRPEIDNRDEINRFAGKYNPIEWRWLAADLGGSDTAWYIIFKELNLLKIVWHQRPHFTAWVDEDIEAYKFKGRMFYDTGASGWRALFGSTGL